MEKSLRWITGALLLCFPLSLAPAWAAQSTENFSALRIDQVRREFNLAYSSGDAARLAALIAPDALWMPPGEPAVSGREAIRKRYEAQFAGTRSLFLLHPGEISVILNMAWLRGDYHREDRTAGGDTSTTITGKYLMTFRWSRGDWLITGDMWNASETPLTVDAGVALASLRSLTEWRLADVSRSLALLAGTGEVRTGDWNAMSGLLKKLAGTGILANAIWFVRPDGYYYTVDLGFTGLNLSDRSYFPGLMAGQSVHGTLVLSRSTGKRSVILAEPVVSGGKVIGGLGVSYSVDQLSAEIDQRLQLPSRMVFYALDMNGQTALHRDPTLMFEYPSDLGDESLRSAVAEMLSKDKGTVHYVFRNMRKTVFFEKSALLRWVFALGFSEPVAGDLR